MKSIKGNLSKQSYRARANPSHPVHKEFRRMRQTMLTEIKKAKADTWVAYLTDADESMMWKCGK